MRTLLPLALLLAAAPAWAQRTEVAVLAGYTTAGDIESDALGIQDLAIDGGFSWGFEAGHFFTPHLGVEVSWVRRESALAFTSTGTPVELFDLNASQWHGSVAYQFGAEGSGLRPFLTGGLGVTAFDASDLEGETKLAPTVGAGLKWFPSTRLGVRLQARYTPTFLDDTDSDFCDPFGFCQSWLTQFDVLGGLVLRF